VKRLLLILTIFFFLLIGKAREIKQRASINHTTHLFFFFFIFQVGRFIFIHFSNWKGDGGEMGGLLSITYFTYPFLIFQAEE